jgi:hypothetical protein
MTTEIIDLLTVPYANCPKFTVDTTGPIKVLVTNAVASIFYTSGGINNYFQQADNFEVLSAGFAYPFSSQRHFEVNGLPPLSIVILAKGKTTGYTYPFKNLGSNSGVNIPIENYDMSINIFMDVQNLPAQGGNLLNAEKFSIFGGLIAASEYVSMVGVPSALNGLVLPIVPFIKVKHNFPLTSI